MDDSKPINININVYVYVYVYIKVSMWKCSGWDGGLIQV